jgi:phosphopantothenate-cysteine ligase
MKILITSGGTKVPLDPVRDITNMSKGTFGSKIATEFLNDNHKVTYLISENGKTPFTFSYNLYESDSPEQIKQLRSKMAWTKVKKHLYQEYHYRNYQDYAKTLEKLVKETQPDITILTAAVSDYITTPSNTKVKSNQDLTIQLTKAPKVISNIKNWAPNTILVGFKLLVNSTKEELIQASLDSINTNNCDIVVANDLKSIKDNNHQIYLITKTSQEFMTNNLANEVMKVALKVKENVVVPPQKL